MEHGKSSVLTGLTSLPLWEVNKKNNNNNNAYVMHKLLKKKKSICKLQKYFNNIIKIKQQ